ncbi:hypothetical protein [Halorarum salinum]|uniref:Uncharacterized protein n=1 Tax=Halorarum salinum TaxID=2743089 RepID=A0A7D5QCX0_9EURY|nr:hypothetical protein [Halobaculum salinum]QLG63678.1 hypothetical protein HUG12_18860 [Halobaculum salinum]
MTDPPFPLSGTTLVTGPSNVGKTRLTARAIEAWVDRHGVDGVVVLDFGPELEHEGRVLGGRLSRFGALPDGVWQGVLEAHAPRAEGGTVEESVRLAEDNGVRARRLLEGAPADPRAVFVNDATIPFQHERGAVRLLTDYCDRAEAAVLNAFESDELGTDDPVSVRERAALAALRERADRVVRLDDGDG